MLSLRHKGSREEEDAQTGLSSPQKRSLDKPLVKTVSAVLYCLKSHKRSLNLMIPYSNPVLEEVIDFAVREGFSSSNGVILAGHTFLCDTDVPVPDYISDEDVECANYLVSDEGDLGVYFMSDGKEEGVDSSLTIYWDNKGRISSQLFIPQVYVGVNDSEVEDLMTEAEEKVNSIANYLGVPNGTITFTFGLILVPWKVVRDWSQE